MNKDEILKMAQKEGNDEMMLQIRDKSIKWTYIAMVVAVAIFSFIRSEQGLPMMDLSATMGFSVFVGETYRYVKCKEKGFLVIAVIALIVAIAATIRFAMGY